MFFFFLSLKTTIFEKKITTNLNVNPFTINGNEIGHTQGIFFFSQICRRAFEKNHKTKLIFWLKCSPTDFTLLQHTQKKY